MPHPSQSHREGWDVHRPPPSFCFGNYPLTNQSKDRHFDRSRAQPQRERRSEKSASSHHRSANKFQNHQRDVHNNHAIDHILSTFLQSRNQVCSPKRQRKKAGKPKQPSNNQELATIHHNSPQNPKTRFIHSQVVRPQLLTFASRKIIRAPMGAFYTSPRPRPGFGTNAVSKG